MQVFCSFEVTGLKQKLQPKYIINVVCILYILASVLLFAAAASFSVFNGDDYTITVFTDTRTGSVFSHIARGFRFLAREYFAWQGTYFYSFLYGALNPLAGGGLPQLRVFMALNAAVFLVSVLFAVYAAVYRRGAYPLSVSLICAAVLLFALLNAGCYTEAFTWFTGTIDFSTPLSAGLFGFGFYLMQFRTKKRAHAVAAGVLLFLASGGTLSVAGALCYAVLIVLVYERLREGTFRRPAVLIWLASFAGALINTAAPGNYKRYDLVDAYVTQTLTDTYVIGEESSFALHPFAAVAKTVTRYFLRLDHLLSDTPLGIALVAMLCVGAIAYREQEQKPVSGMLLTAVACSLLTPAVALFPLFMGGPYDAGWLPDRIDFVFDTAMVSTLCCLFFLCGLLLAHAGKHIGQTVLLAMLSLILFTGVYANRLNLFDLEQYGMGKAVASGEMRAYHDACAKIYDTLAESPGEDVVLTLPPHCEYLYPLDWLDDPAEWKNVLMSKYYGCASFRGITEGR